MVVKQANITSYKVSDPSDILDRRPVSYVLLLSKSIFLLNMLKIVLNKNEN